MNRFTAWTTAVSAAVVLAVGVTGCGVSTSDSAPPRQADARTAPCNLGAEWDAAALVTRATYIEPSLTEELRQRYVGMIANDSCGDAEVLNWQDLRRARCAARGRWLRCDAIDG